MKNKEQYFQQIYEQLKDKIYRLCLGFMGNKSDADDLYQEVLIKIWRNLENFRNESNINTWVYRITTNTALFTLNKENKLNKKNRDFKAIEQPTEIENFETSVNEQRIKNLYKAISTLKEIDRIIIGLLLEECSYAQISNITGISISNVGVRISRIKKSLNKKLK
ncbi:RNA polymerase sigma factor [Lacinutrix sp.]|uniref:RNA polymerase sigma factor n=1 Tax=Lacinutrix sp. TaxID=1937692 RepID=UPI0025B90A5B|nr:RNA polymerase sigma factor [Lacinutrix sp.]